MNAIFLADILFIGLAAAGFLPVQPPEHIVPDTHSILLHGFFPCFGPPVIVGYAHYLKTLLMVFVEQHYEMRVAMTTGYAPACPEIDQYIGFPLEGGKGQWLAIDVHGGEILCRATR